MTIEVQMLARRPKGPGEWYEKGVTYTLSDDLAEVFIRGGAARRTSLISEVTDYPAKLQAAGKRFDVQDGLVVPLTATADGAQMLAGTVSGYIVPGAPAALPAGWDDAPRINRALRLAGGKINLGQGHFRLASPIINEHYGFVDFGSSGKDLYGSKGIKIFGAGNETTIITSAVVGEASIRVSRLDAPEGNGTFFDVQLKGFSLYGPGLDDPDTTAIQLGGYDYAGQVTEQTEIDCVISNFTNILRGDDCTGVKLGKSKFRRFRYGCEFNYNADLFDTEEADFGNIWPRVSGKTVTSGQATINVGGGLDLIVGMIVLAQNSSTGANLLPVGTRLQAYDSVTGIATLTANATGSVTNGAEVQFNLGRAVVMRSALKVGCTFTAGTNVITAASPTNWTTGLVAGQVVKGEIGANKLVVPEGTTIVSITDGQTIVVSNNVTAAGVGNVYVRDQYGTWEPRSAFPGGGMPNKVRVAGGWAMRLEGVLYQSDGGNAEVGMYVERCPDVGVFGWAGSTKLPNNIKIQNNHFSIMHMCPQAPLRTHNKSSGTDSQTTVYIADNTAWNDRGNPTAGAIGVSWIDMQTLTGNDTVRGLFHFERNYLPTSSASVPTGNLGTFVGTFYAPTDAHEVLFGTIKSGNYVISHNSGTLATWSGSLTDAIILSPTSACTINNPSNTSFQFGGRTLTVVIKQGATPYDVTFGSKFKDATGAALGTVAGAGQANKRTAIVFESSGNDSWVATKAIVWQ